MSCLSSVQRIPGKSSSRVSQSTPPPWKVQTSLTRLKFFQNRLPQIPGVMVDLVAVVIIFPPSGQEPPMEERVMSRLHQIYRLHPLVHSPLITNHHTGTSSPVHYIRSLAPLFIVWSHLSMDTQTLPQSLPFPLTCRPRLPIPLHEPAIPISDSHPRLSSASFSSLPELTHILFIS